jgi:hypothetical protein
MEAVKSRLINDCVLLILSGLVATLFFGYLFFNFSSIYSIHFNTNVNDYFNKLFIIGTLFIGSIGIVYLGIIFWIYNYWNPK